jgi:nicotinamide/nicotinate riboside kinase
MLIGISGCSRSGKTELSESLVWHYRQCDKRTFSIHQDNYVFDRKRIPTVNGETDWDTPLSIDFELLQEAIQFYTKHFEVLIVEGIYALYHPPINAVFDRTIYVDISKKTFLERRKADTRWGIEPDWYLEHVWQSHLDYGIPTTDLPSLQTVSGETPYNIDDIVQQFN